MVSNEMMNAFWRMIRPVNLLIIIFTQVLLRYFVILPLLRDSDSYLQMSQTEFILLVFSTVMIAAAGYIINDILDTGIDKINKPKKASSISLISKEMQEYLYYGLNIIGILAGIFVSLMVGKIELGIIFVIVATMLYYYSLKYKYLTFWGNFTVSILVSVTLVIVWLFEFFAFRAAPGNFVEAFPSFQIISVFVFSYALFAFLTNLSREITKDMEDVVGDSKNGCMTIPVRFGEKTAKKIVLAINILTLILLIASQYFAYTYQYPLLAYCLSIPAILLLILIFRGGKTHKQVDHARNGKMLKLIMIAGIASMIFVTLRMF